MKKGQVSIFLIIGTGILFAIILYFTLRNTGVQVAWPENIAALTSCTEKTVESVIADISFQGGYSQMPDSVFSTAMGDIPVYITGNITRIPKFEEVKSALEEETKERLTACRNVSIKASMMLSDNDVRAIVKYHEREITVSVPARIAALHRVAQEVTKRIEKDPLVIPSSELLDIEKKENVDISAVWDESTIAYFITTTRGMPIVWSFAVRE